MRNWGRQRRLAGGSKSTVNYGPLLFFYGAAFSARTEARILSWWFERVAGALQRQDISVVSDPSIISAATTWRSNASPDGQK